ncbi:hypothetical protein [Streptomyces sp. NPDC002952]|uniref:hypothetical protein n=1 Tax=Streptomyces sp. NPDC002952 TaxID=3364673 RepID=UPI0036A35ECD
MPTSPGPLLQALDALWQRIRVDHPELPNAQISVSPNPPRGDHGPERWRWVDDETITGIVISAETLSAGPESVVECMRHEATHILCWRRDIKDTTMHGGYHNQNFLAVAEELGLVWPDGRERETSRGYSNAELSAETLSAHLQDVEALAEAIPVALPRLTAPASSARRVSRLTMTCGCKPARKMMMSRTIAELGPVDCRICGEEFKASA